MLIKHGDGKVLSVVKVSDDSEVELDENGNPVVKQEDPKNKKIPTKKSVRKNSN